MNKFIQESKLLWYFIKVQESYSIRSVQLNIFSQVTQQHFLSLLNQRIPSYLISRYEKQATEVG